MDTTAITAAPPIGNFAYGLITVANQEPITVHSGSVTDTLTLLDPLRTHFTVANDGHGGTDVMLLLHA